MGARKGKKKEGMVRREEATVPSANQHLCLPFFLPPSLLSSFWPSCLPPFLSPFSPPSPFLPLL